MFAAALIAAAFTAPSVRAALESALGVIPASSRLARGVRRVMSPHEAGLDWADTVDTATGESPGGWIHVVPNAAVLTAGLLYGEPNAAVLTAGLLYGEPNAAVLTAGLLYGEPNAAVLTAGLLYGDDDFTRTPALTVRGGLDTGSNGATAGSMAGVRTGAAALPGHWTEPLEDTVRSAVFGFDGVRISALAERRVRLARGGSQPCPRPRLDTLPP
ncbi:hypothetical protein GR129_28840 [Streptomyces sp. HF10]|nr:hypothetical protein GR129_28840 [Streptomyces sp. HF10]